jgi:hypothetical protein
VHSYNFDDLKAMAHSPIYNYIVPGLTSYMIQDFADGGKIRLFHASRDQQEFVIPHNHRFDLTSIVIKGEVENTIWEETQEGRQDLFQMCRLYYNGSPGVYSLEKYHPIMPFKPVTNVYTPGQFYNMEADTIHSIKFKKDTWLLIIQGPELRSDSTILQPYVNGEMIQTFKVEDWMFQTNRGDA